MNGDVIRRKKHDCREYLELSQNGIYTYLHTNSWHRRNMLFEFTINPSLQLWDTAGQNADSHGMEPTHFMKNGTGVPTVSVDW